MTRGPLVLVPSPVQLLFDVPKSVKLQAIELHDSFVSGGVRITLR
ncbi:hypothetical protein GCM10022226_78400 [Sphaerisporangium flaviroseum]|uniref:Uncharacterized protein n=1 Tax=Sphaerisporangium flaviroseum TaxID=509199 RepID=A0ABP7JG00_9ACTN